MSKHVPPKTSREAQPQSKPTRLRKPEKIRQLAPTSARDAAKKEVSQPDPELFIYERAIVLFNAGRFQAAKEAFAKLTGARNRDLALSAELRIRMCEKRLAPAGSAMNLEIP